MKLKTQLIKSKLIISLIAIALLSAGCGGGSAPVAGPVTLTFWKPFENTENLQPLFDAYMAKHPNVTIVYSKKDIKNYEEELIDDLASGTGPDIFSINNSWLPEYMDKIAPAPEKTFSIKEYKDAFVDVVMSDFTEGNKIYGTAMSVDSLALYYNKDLMGTVGIATPPKTWGELSADTQKIKRLDNKGYFTRSGAALGTNANINRAADIVYLFMLQQGAVPFSSEGQPTFADQVEKNGNYINPGIAGFTYYTSFAQPSSINYNWNAKSDYSIDAFANGRVAYLYSYAYTRQTIKQKSPNLNFDVAAVPQPNLDNPSVNFANYWGEVVSKQSKNQAVAWDLLKFMTSKEALDKYYAQNKVPSSRKDLVELQIQDPEIGVFAHANLTAKSFYKPDQAKIDDIFGTAIDNVILRGFTASEAMNQAVQQAALVGRKDQ